MKSKKQEKKDGLEMGYAIIDGSIEPCVVLSKSFFTWEIGLCPEFIDDSRFSYVKRLGVAAYSVFSSKEKAESVLLKSKVEKLQAGYTELEEKSKKQAKYTYIITAIYVAFILLDILLKVVIK